MTIASRWIVVSSLMVCAIASAQTPAAPKQFDVATIKPNASNDNRVMLGLPLGGRFTTTGVSLKLLVTEAYNVRDFQVTGGPGWISSDRWDINAKVDGMAERIPIEQMRPMLQVLLADRFQLKVHEETKEMPLYVLTVGKNGSKLQENTGDPGPMLRMGRGQLSGKKVAIAMLIQPLSQILGRTVVDKTGLTGEFDFTLDWTPELGQGGVPGAPPGGDAPPAGDSSGPSVFTAIQEQLGLRLDSQKGPVEIIVIDHVDKPSDN